jgi:hypothetical protein
MSTFQEAIPQHIQEKITEVEADIQQNALLLQHRKWTRELSIGCPTLEALMGGSQNTGTQVELYWHMKMLLGQMLQTREEAQSTIQLQLDEFHLLLRKILSRLPPSSSTTTTQINRQAVIAPPQEPPTPPPMD